MGETTREPAPGTARRRLTLSEPLSAVLLFVLSAASAGLLLSLPRAVEPKELPVLLLHHADVSPVLAADAAAARSAPHTPIADELRSLLRAQGAAEVTGNEDALAYQRRRERMEQAHRELVALGGEGASRGLRAEAMAQLDEALALRLPAPRAAEVLGAMPAILAREGCAQDGTVLAPLFVVRTLFKSRWNLLHGLAPDHDFAKVERVAFFGWQALHAERLPIPRRVDALREYARAGGEHADEALAVLLLRSGQLEEAAVVLEAVAASARNLRLRNYALFASPHRDQAP